MGQDLRDSGKMGRCMVNARNCTPTEENLKDILSMVKGMEGVMRNAMHLRMWEPTKMVDSTVMVLKHGHMEVLIQASGKMIVCMGREKKEDSVTTSIGVFRSGYLYNGTVTWTKTGGTIYEVKDGQRVKDCCADCLLL